MHELYNLRVMSAEKVVYLDNQPREADGPCIQLQGINLVELDM